MHFTFIISFVLIAWTLATSFMPNYFGNLSEFDYWIMGAIGAIVLFVSVLIHELAHSLVALRYGIKVRQILLFIFGGVSDIAQEAILPLRRFLLARPGCQSCNDFNCLSVT